MSAHAAAVVLGWAKRPGQDRKVDVKALIG